MGERGKETEDRLHIKWTGNEPGYIESVGKSVCRGASLSAKFARLFTWRTFRLHRVHARAQARKRGCIVRGENGMVVARIYMYICIKYMYIYIEGGRGQRVEGRSLVKSAQDARNGQPFSTFAIA